MARNTGREVRKLRRLVGLSTRDSRFGSYRKKRALFKTTMFGVFYGSVPFKGAAKNLKISLRKACAEMNGFTQAFSRMESQNKR